MRGGVSELAGKTFRRLADQIGLADAGKKARKRADPAGLRLAAGDPENVGEAGQRLRRRIRIRGFRVIDEQHAPDAADLLHAMREPRKRREALLDFRGRQAERQRGARGAGGVLRVVQPAQRADAAQIGDGTRVSAGLLHDLLSLEIKTTLQRPRH